MGKYLTDEEIAAVRQCKYFGNTYRDDSGNG